MVTLLETYAIKPNFAVPPIFNEILNSWNWLTRISLQYNGFSSEYCVNTFGHFIYYSCSSFVVYVSTHITLSSLLSFMLFMIVQTRICCSAWETNVKMHESKHVCRLIMHVGCNFTSCFPFQFIDIHKKV